MSTISSVIPRRWDRQPANSRIGLVLKGGHVKTDDSAITVDISVRGASVRTTLMLVPGNWVGVVPSGEFPHAIPSRVVWVREDEYSHWTFAGLEFLDTLEH